MTAQERKKKQYQLEALKARKAKADQLGPTVIARTQAKYNGILAEIQRLEQELAEDQGSPLDALAGVLHEALTWAWPNPAGVDVWELCNKIDAGITERINRIEREMTAAYNLGRQRKLEELVPMYRQELKKMHQVVSAPPIQTSLFSQFQEVEVDVPF